MHHDAPIFPIIKESSKFKTRWDILIIIFAIYNAVTIPLALSFVPTILETVGG